MVDRNGAPLVGYRRWAPRNASSAPPRWSSGCHGAEDTTRCTGPSKPWLDRRTGHRLRGSMPRTRLCRRSSRTNNNRAAIDGQRGSPRTLMLPDSNDHQPRFGQRIKAQAAEPQAQRRVVAYHGYRPSVRGSRVQGGVTGWEVAVHRLHRQLLVGLVALAVVLSGCDWTMFGYDAANTRSSPDTRSTRPTSRVWFCASLGAPVARSTCEITQCRETQQDTVRTCRIVNDCPL
jgi:hypothetical protein